MDKPSECNVLSEILNETPACQETCSSMDTPSYMYDSAPKGCLLAHVILTLIEMQRVSYCFKIPLYNLFMFGAVRRNLELSEDHFWGILSTSSFLHDVGKLVDEYVDRSASRQSYIAHHQISAIIARKVLEKISDDSTALKIAYAILFHHEAFDWRVVKGSLLLFSYLQKAFSTTQRITYTVSPNRLDRFKQNICGIIYQISQRHMITQLQHQILIRALTYMVQELITSQRMALYMDQELSVTKVQDPSYLTPALSSYRLLYLADNRAASARDQYWLKLIQQVDWCRLEDIARQISHFLTQRYYYIGLSAIPKINSVSSIL